MDAKHSFVHQMQSLVEWIDGDAVHLAKEEILRVMRLRVRVMAQKLIAYPHCENFSLMPVPTGGVENAARDEKHSFVRLMESLMEWTDGAATRMGKEDIIETMKIDVLFIARKFIADPRCENFSLG